MKDTSLIRKQNLREGDTEPTMTKNVQKTANVYPIEAQRRSKAVHLVVIAGLRGSV